MIKLRDEKLIDKIMSIIRENLWQDYNIDLWDCIKSELGVYLTQPTDEGIEPLNENIIQLYDSVRFWTAWDNVDEFIRHVYMKLGNHFTNVEGIEKEEPTEILSPAIIEHILLQIEDILYRYRTLLNKSKNV